MAAFWRIGWRLPVALLLVAALTACGGRGKQVRPTPTDRGTPSGVTRPADPAAPDPCAVVYEHRDEDYTAGGLYRPGQRDHAPVGQPDWTAIAQPVPRHEPLAAYGNRSPYSVLGKSYRVLDDPRGYRERGIASWYGAKFHGRATSSMEPYDMCAFTAAHKTLPLPSYARVTHLDNGRSIIVRVNDRGPFHDGRVIDLSYVAALALGVYQTGTARVEVEAIVPGGAPPRAIPASVAGPANGEGQVFVQLGAFGERDNARALQRRLRDAGEKAEVVRGEGGSGRLYRVRLGPFANAAAAERARARLGDRGFASATIVIAD